MDCSDWVLIGSTIILATTAFLAPYLLEKWKYNYRKGKLQICFKHEAPFSHLTVDGNNNYVYYFRIFIKNIGKTQVEQCEVSLEKLFKKNELDIYEEMEWITPSSLKWSGFNEPWSKTIQPGRRFFCDIGHIYCPDIKPNSIYKSKSQKDNNSYKFWLELTVKYNCQWDYLPPGEYRLDLTVFSNNADKQSKSFYISWSGKWIDSEKEMFKEIVIHE